MVIGLDMDGVADEALCCSIAANIVDEPRQIESGSQPREPAFGCRKSVGRKPPADETGTCLRPGANPNGVGW